MATQPDPTSPPTQEQISILSKYTACDIADALLQLKVPNAGFLSDLELIAPQMASPEDEFTIAAPVSTVMMASKSGQPPADCPQSNIPDGKHWVDLTEPDTIVVMTQAEGQKCAVLGGIMALRMKVLNARGVVVRGRVRDVVELRGTGLPIWARATSIVGTGLEAKPHAVQVPLNFDGTIVNPGDVVFGDTTNGVVVIPLDKLAATISLLPKLVQADDKVKEDVSKGMSVQEAFKKHRG